MESLHSSHSLQPSTTHSSKDKAFGFKSPSSLSTGRGEAVWWLITSSSIDDVDAPAAYTLPLCNSINPSQSPFSLSS
eukprot:scaffold1195_cov200-Alexandrium_tamarense.AAC.13